MFRSVAGKLFGSGNGAHKSEKEFIYVYLFFFCAFSIAYETHCRRSRLGLSTFITLAVALQLLAYSLLALKVVKQQSVQGVSGKTLICNAVVYCARLSSTTWLKGYIPTDSTGNWLYQLTDAMCLVMVLILLYHVFRRYRATYQAEEDTFDIGYLLSGCFVLAVVLHPHLNNRPVFDTLWTFALYVDMFGMMPQLWMIAKLGVGATIEPLNAHYIMAVAASRGVSLYFWSYGFREFRPKDGSFNFTGWAIIGANIIQILLLLDFIYYYLKNWMCVRCIEALKQAGVESYALVAQHTAGEQGGEEVELESAPVEVELESAPVSAPVETKSQTCDAI